MKIVSHKVAKLAKEKGCDICDKLVYIQDWLLCFHNIWVEPILNFVPDTIDDYGFRVCIYTHTDQWNNVKWETNKPCSKIFKTPWEALDEGLYEALKLIP